MATEQQKLEVKAVIDKWRAAMSDVDIETLKSLWDQKNPNAIYIAEENEKALIGWAGINGYHDDLVGMKNVNWQYSNLVIDVIGDAAYAFCYSIGQADITSEKRRFEFNMRDTFILRKARGRWKIIHYHESANPKVGPGGRPV